MVESVWTVTYVKTLDTYTSYKDMVLVNLVWFHEDFFYELRAITLWCIIIWWQCFLRTYSHSYVFCQVCVKSVGHFAAEGLCKPAVHIIRTAAICCMKRETNWLSIITDFCLLCRMFHCHEFCCITWLINPRTCNSLVDLERLAIGNDECTNCYDVLPWTGVLHGRGASSGSVFTMAAFICWWGLVLFWLLVLVSG